MSRNLGLGYLAHCQYTQLFFASFLPILIIVLYESVFEPRLETRCYIMITKAKQGIGVGMF